MMLTVDQRICLTIRSTPAHLRVVRAALEKVCELAGLDQPGAGALVLGVDEALTNIIRHVYGNATDKQIDIEVAVVGPGEEDSLQVRVRDYGQYVDPQRIRSRDLADVRPGGLGVHIMTECMDSVDYQPAEGGGTVLTLCKKLPPRPDGDCE